MFLLARMTLLHYKGKIITCCTVKHAILLNNSTFIYSYREETFIFNQHVTQNQGNSMRERERENEEEGKETAGNICRKLWCMKWHNLALLTWLIVCYTAAVAEAFFVLSPKHSLHSFRTLLTVWTLKVSFFSFIAFYRF